MTYFLLAISCAGVFLHRYFHLSDNRFAYTFFKALASLMFFVPGIINFLSVKDKSENFKKSGTLFLYGLFLACFADILIEFNFVAGFLLFFICHFVYLYAFISIKKAEPKHYFAALAFMIATITLCLANPFVYFGKLFPVICVYIGSLCFVTVLSFTAFKLSSPFGKLLAFEGILFLLSDAALQLEIRDFSVIPEEKRFIAGTISNVLYYISQYITVIALSKDIFKEKVNES